jgi:NAD(P)H-hydrate epimerase
MSGRSPRKTVALVMTQDEVRAIDAAAMESLGIPGLVLMENAARGVSEHLDRVCPDGQVTIICGPGNNGGDGLAVARQRAAAGKMSRVVLEAAGKSLTADTQSNLDFLINSGVPVQKVNRDSDCQTLLDELKPEDWIIDSLLGTGGQGELRTPFHSWAQAINASPANVLAVDVPSGMNCDDGTCGAACVRADLTVTFVGVKSGFLHTSAKIYTGEVAVAHIGIPLTWLQGWLLSHRAANATGDLS